MNRIYQVAFPIAADTTVSEGSITQRLALAILPVLITALLGPVLALAQERSRRKARESIREAAISEATSYLAYTDKYFAVQERILTVDEFRGLQRQSGNSIYLRHQALETFLRENAHLPPDNDGPSVYSIRRLLLFYRMHGGAAQFWRVAYYLLILNYGSGVVYFQDDPGLFVISTAIGVLWLWLARRQAVKSDQSARRQNSN